MSKVHTLHEAATSHYPVGVECAHCIRRALVPKDTLNASRDDHRKLSEIGLRCSKCGSREFTTTLFDTRSAAHTFVRNH
jgi:bacterioferritin-associated ferredoxin